MRDNTADYYESSEFQQILQKFEEMIDNGSTLYLDASDIADIVDYYVLSSEQEKVETALEYGMRLHPNDDDIIIANINNLLAQGNTKMARQFAEMLEDPTNQEILYIKGLVELADDNTQESRAYFDQSFNNSNNDLGLIDDIILELTNKNYDDEVQYWLNIAFEKMTKPIPIFYEYQADLYYRTNQYDKAIEWYNKQLDIFPFDSYPWEQIGKIYFLREDYTKARECYEYALAINDDNHEAMLMKADCYINIHDYKTALELYKELLEKAKEYENILTYCCGKCHFHLHNYDLAMEYLTRTEENLDENDSEKLYIEVYNLMARIHIVKHNEDEALKYIYKGLAIDPDDIELNLLINMTKQL